MRSNVIVVFTVLICLTANETLRSQQFPNLKKVVQSYIAPPKISVKGYAVATYQGTRISGMENRIDPSFLRINSSLLIKTGPVNTSFYFNFSDGLSTLNSSGLQLNLPSFAFVGISPSYKWATLHLGNRNMEFSRYSLANHSFEGVGLELKPGIFRASGMYGKLRRATIGDLSALQEIDPAFDRIGWGIKIGLDNDKEAIAISLFSAKDKVESGGQELGIYPAENAILSLNGRKKIGNRVTIQGELSMSSFTENAILDFFEDEGYSLLDTKFGLFKPRLSSNFQNAIHLKADISFSKGSLQIGYERVDPLYRTLGAMFFMNDFENVTGGLSYSTTDGKWNIMADLGFQRNNLSNQEVNQNNRLIGNVMISYKPSDRINASVNFSNFRTSDKLRVSSLPFTTLDSIVLALINTNIGGNMIYFIDNERKKSFSMSMGYQSAQSVENDEVIESSKNTNLFINVIYNQWLKDYDLRLGAGLIYNKNSGFFNSITTIGPQINMAKNWVEDKLETKLTLAYMRLTELNLGRNDILRPRLTIKYNLRKTQSIQFVGTFIRRNNTMISLKNFTEIMGRLEWRIRW